MLMKKTPPLQRLKLLLDNDFEDEIPDPDGILLDYFIDPMSFDMPFDYSVPFEMANHDFTNGHIAFRRSTDSESTENSIKMELPDMALTDYGAWVYRLCTMASEKLFQSELARWKAGDYSYDPLVGSRRKRGV